MLALTVALSMSTGLASAQSERPDLSATHYGGCILLERIAEAPDELYSNSGVVPSDRYKPFTKEVIVNGYAFAGRDDISDEFMEKVATTVVEMLPQGDGIDRELQESFIRDMYEYGALIPFYEGRSRIESDEDRAAWNVTRSKNSVCDVIMEAPGRGQVMEVVEHILHYANDVGLHYTFPDEWALTTDSQLYKFMQEAIEKKIYNLREDISERPNDRRVRGSMQEFGYWVITTAWNLQEPYGPHIDEWTLKDADDMKQQMPELYEMVQQTVGKIMVSPSIATLETFNE
jgi:hypothetical protein